MRPMNPMPTIPMRTMSETSAGVGAHAGLSYRPLPPAEEPQRQRERDHAPGGEDGQRDRDGVRPDAPQPAAHQVRPDQPGDEEVDVPRPRLLDRDFGGGRDGRVGGAE